MLSATLIKTFSSFLVLIHMYIHLKITEPSVDEQLFQENDHKNEILSGPYPPGWGGGGN